MNLLGNYSNWYSRLKIIVRFAIYIKHTVLQAMKSAAFELCLEDMSSNSVDEGSSGLTIRLQ
jgi:hypothetical protein